MYKLYTKEDYDNTKKLLKDFIHDVRVLRKMYSLEKRELLTCGHITQIKDFVTQLRTYRRDLRQDSTC